MKSIIKSIFAFLVLAVVSATAQQVQLVTLLVNEKTSSISYDLTTNQIVKIVTITGESSTYPSSVTITPATGQGFTTTNNITFTGMENIQFFAGLNSVSLKPFYYSGLLTMEITTPSTANVISNYVPADAIVIPASATGNAQIILESSADLVNWTAASPGIYGASSATNRFFRVRAAMLP